MDYLKAFVIGGAICMLGQVLIDLTRLTSARILVCYVVLGVILGGAGVYEKLVEFAGAGATVPLTGFGNTLAKGVREAVQEQGILGALTGGLKASAAGIAAAVFSDFSRRWCAVRRINPDAAGKLPLRQRRKLSLQEAHHEQAEQDEQGHAEHRRHAAESVLEELQVTKGRYRGAVPSFCMVPPSPYRRRHRCTL